MFSSKGRKQYITSQEVQIKSAVTANHSTPNLATINVLKRSNDFTQSNSLQVWFPQRYMKISISQDATVTT